MRTHIARSSAEMDSLRGLWNHLYANFPGATLFQSFAWNRLAAECFAVRQAPAVVAVESDSGAAIIPACIDRSDVRLLGEELFDYRDVLAVGDDECLRAAWSKLAELRLPLAVTALRGETARQRWSEFEPNSFVTAPQVLRAELGAGQFASQHSRLGRTLRLLAKEGVTLHRRCGSAVDLVRWIYRQKAAQFEAGKNLFRDSRRIDFLTAACAICGGDCEVFTLETNSPIAALVTFGDRGVRRFYTIYFDPAWARYSPGTALVYEVTRRSLAEGMDCDYMTGEQPHKTRFMTSAVPLYRVNASAETLEKIAAQRGSVPLAA